MNNTVMTIAVVLMGTVLLLGVIYSLVQRVSEFQSELRYLNMEVRRTRGAEQKHYRRLRRRLWLSLLPFVR